MENNATFPSTLFRSKLRQRLLSLLFTNPESRYYVRQLHGMLKVSIGSLHRELKQLAAAGVLKSEKQGNLKFYSANSDYPLFDELKRIIAKTMGVEGSIRDALRDIPGVGIAFIYGSFAAGKEAERSDVDLFLIGRFDEGLLNKRLRELEEHLAREINYVSMTEKEFIEEKKKRSHFLRQVLKEPKLFLIGNENEIRRLA